MFGALPRASLPRQKQTENPSLRNKKKAEGKQYACASIESNHSLKATPVCHSGTARSRMPSMDEEKKIKESKEAE